MLLTVYYDFVPYRTAGGSHSKSADNRNSHVRYIYYIYTLRNPVYVHVYTYVYADFKFTPRI